MKKKTSKKIEEEKTTEIFEVEKMGRKSIIKKEVSVRNEKEMKKNQITKENKMLRNIFIVIVILFLLILGGIFALNKVRNFEYEGVKFQTVKFCDTKPCLILYQTKLPVELSDGSKAEYNFYLRNDPRKLDDVMFDGDMNFLPNVVISSKGNLSCNGDGVIAAANLVNLYKI